MSMHEELERIASGHLDVWLENQDPERALRAMQAGRLRLEEMALLLSPGAGDMLEHLAQQAKKTTRRQFGNTLHLYAPLYLSDYCVNQCTYCGFRNSNSHSRRRLEPDEIRKEVRWLAREGFRNLLLVTGESRAKCSMDYLEEAVCLAREHMPMIGIEIHPLETGEYAQLHEAGVEYLALYQETYDRDIYRIVHPRGPKADFENRLHAPERGCLGGLNAVHLGVLMGLAPWRREVLSLAVHGRWLQRRYPGTKIGFSLPRLRQAAGMSQAVVPVTDQAFCQALFALRLWMPSADHSLSTRESAAMRDGLLPISVTRISAGSCTSVGGYGEVSRTEVQFHISDERSLGAMCAAVREKGLNPVLSDWVPLRGELAHV